MEGCEATVRRDGPEEKSADAEPTGLMVMSIGMRRDHIKRDEAVGNWEYVDELSIKSARGGWRMM